MTREGIGRFVNVTEVAAMVGRKFRHDMDKEVRRDRVHDVTLYRWADVKTRKDGKARNNSQLFMSYEDADKIREYYGLEPLDVEPYPYKDHYDTSDIAEILGVSRITAYWLHNEASLELEQVTTQKIATASLRKWFGEGLIKSTELGENKYHEVPEVAQALGISKKRIQGLIDSGDLEVLPLSHVTKKLAINHRDLVNWIKSRQEEKIQTLQKEEVAS